MNIKPYNLSAIKDIKEADIIYLLNNSTPFRGYILNNNEFVFIPDYKNDEFIYYILPFSLVNKVININPVSYDIQRYIINFIKNKNYTLISSKYKTSLLENKIPQPKRKQFLKEFIKFCIKELGLNQSPLPLPKLKLTNNKSDTSTYGHFDPNNNNIVVYIKNRSFNDIARTICHELIHERQRQKNQLTHKSGEDGSAQENEANAIAGVIMRKWGRIYPETYE